MENEPEYLLKQAARCRNAATATSDHNIRRTLLGMAKDYEKRAAALLENNRG